MGIYLSWIHQFVVSAAHSIVTMLYRVSTWILVLCGYQGADAANKLLAFFLVALFMSSIFSIYWWPTRGAQQWVKLMLWPIIVFLILYTMFVFFTASVDVLSASMPHA